MDKTLHLMKQTFDYWNAFKRYQTLEEIEREKGNIEESRWHELNKYKTMNKLELSLRALQKELREQAGTHSNEENEE